MEIAIIIIALLFLYVHIDNYNSRKRYEDEQNTLKKEKDKVFKQLWDKESQKVLDKYDKLSNEENLFKKKKTQKKSLTINNG
jgi:GTPase involved in cell partitioning and DNA repair